MLTVAELIGRLRLMELKGGERVIVGEGADYYDADIKFVPIDVNGTGPHNIVNGGNLVVLITRKT